MSLLDDALGPLHGLVGLLPHLHEPVFIYLRRYGDGVIGVKDKLATVILGQEFIDHALRRHPYQRLGVGKERTVAADSAGEEHPGVLGNPPSHHAGVVGLLGRGHPVEQPAKVSHCEGIVMFGAESSWVVQGPVAYHSHHRQAQACGYRDGLEGVEPAHAAGAHEGAGADGAGVLHDLELGVLALGDDELAIEVAVSDETRHVLHHCVVGTYGISGDGIDVGH